MTSAGEEAVQLECHEGTVAGAAALVRRPAHENEHGLNLRAAARFISLDLRGKTLGSICDGDGRPPRQPLAVLETNLSARSKQRAGAHAAQCHRAYLKDRHRPQLRDAH
jgi:hypothetical protein